MKYIFFTFDGNAFPIAYKLQQAGHDVIVGQVQDVKDTVISLEKEPVGENEVEKERRLLLFDNMVEKMPVDKLIDWMKMIQNPKEFFVCFDFNNLFKYSEAVSKMGFYGNFPTEKDRLLEVDRDFAKEFVRKYYPRLNIPEVKEFHKVKDAIEFINISNDFWAVKGLSEGAQTFVPDTEDLEFAKSQLIGTLEAFQKDYERAGFILEFRIPSPAEFTPEKIYYDGVPLALTVNIEDKPLGSGNLSVQTGCASDLVFPISMEERINEIAFPPIIDEMAKAHKGLFFWDASLIINRRGGKIYFGEFCSNRPGYNSFFTELAQVDSIDQFFMSVSRKINPYRLGTVASSMRIFNLHRSPDDRHVLAGVAVDFKPEIKKDVWLFDVLKKDDKLVTAGYDWNLAVITGTGYSINESVKNMYENIERFSFMGAYYRPKSDYLSLDYPTSILNRLNYGLDRRLYHLPFDVKVGEIEQE